MPRSIELLRIRRARQLIGLAQVRNTLPRADQSTVVELYDAATKNGGVVVDSFDEKQFEMIDTLAKRHLCEVVS